MGAELTQDNLCVVVGFPAVITDFEELYISAEPSVYYDTTFCLGDFYVSCLMYHNSVFVSAPVTPLLMMHECHTTDSHQLLFHWFNELTDVTHL